MNATPIITLTTDFATQDGYVAAMIGVILRQCPSAHVVSITHEVPPRDLRAAAWALRNAWPYFPAGTIHVVVVDPGVGSERRGILVRAARHTFIGPDNGLLLEAISGEMLDAVRELTNPAARAAQPSPTFHGRDVFAWAAGWIAAGREWPAVGPPLPTGDLIRLPDLPPRVERDADGATITGAVMLADRFGNLITTITDEWLTSLFGKGVPQVSVNGQPIHLGRTFSDVAEGDAVAYVGSSGYLEIAVNSGSALELFGQAAEIVLKGHKETASAA